MDWLSLHVEDGVGVPRFAWVPKPLPVTMTVGAVVASEKATELMVGWGWSDPALHGAPAGLGRPVWSAVTGHRPPVGLEMSPLAWFPGRSAIVSVGPPLSARGPSKLANLVFDTSPAPPIRQDALEATLSPKSIQVPPA